MKIKSIAKVNLQLLPPLLAITLTYFIFATAYRTPQDIFFQKELYAAIALIMNAFFIFQWIKAEKAPKFLIKSSKTLLLKVHVLAVILEIVLCVLAYTTGLPMLALVAAGIALFIHVPTSFYQTPDVQGAKGVMVPTYFLITLLHGFLAVKVLLDPADMARVLDMFLALNIYVLAQILHRIFTFLGTFRYTRYTVSILFSVFIILPFILGPLSNIGFFFLLIMDIYIFQRLMRFTVRQKKDLFLEHDQSEFGHNLVETAMNWNGIYKVLNQNPDYSIEKAYDDKELGRLYFDVLDFDNTGKIDQKGWQEISNNWDIRSDIDRSFFEDISTNGQLNFEKFYSKVWLMGAIDRPAPDFDKLTTATDKEKSKAVFEQLDLYQENKIGKLALSLLLSKWGIRPPEISAFVSRYPEGMSYESFHNDHSSIWKFYVPN